MASTEDDLRRRIQARRTNASVPQVNISGPGAVGQALNAAAAGVGAAQNFVKRRNQQNIQEARAAGNQFIENVGSAIGPGVDAARAALNLQRPEQEAQPQPSGPDVPRTLPALGRLSAIPGARRTNPEFVPEPAAAPDNLIERTVGGRTISTPAIAATATTRPQERGRTAGASGDFGDDTTQPVSVIRAAQAAEDGGGGASGDFGQTQQFPRNPDGTFAIEGLSPDAQQALRIAQLRGDLTPEQVAQLPRELATVSDITRPSATTTAPAVQQATGNAIPTPRPSPGGGGQIIRGTDVSQFDDSGVEVALGESFDDPVARREAQQRALLRNRGNFATGLIALDQAGVPSAQELLSPSTAFGTEQLRQTGQTQRNRETLASQERRAKAKNQLDRDLKQFGLASAEDTIEVVKLGQDANGNDLGEAIARIPAGGGAPELIDLRSLTAQQRQRIDQNLEVERRLFEEELAER